MKNPTENNHDYQMARDSRRTNLHIGHCNKNVAKQCYSKGNVIDVRVYLKEAEEPVESEILRYQG